MDFVDEVLRWTCEQRAPAPVREKARWLLLDTLGCALAALGHPTVARLASLLESGDPGPLRLASRSEGLAPLGAAALLASAACWEEACEGLARAHGRPGVPVIAACLALGVQRGASLAELIDALVTGYEIGGRAGESLRMRAGMHVDAAWPSLGAAAGAARLLGGSVAACRAAVEIAACQVPFSLYLPIEQGAEARNTYLGHAAWLGAFAALAALSGCEAPRGAVDRYAALALGLHESGALPPAGQFVLMEAYLKPYAAARHVHYAAEAALQVRGAIPDTRHIDRVELATYPEALSYCGNRAPRSPIHAQFSLSFGVAAALRFGGLGPEAYRPPAFEDAELRRLEALVELRADERLGEGGQRAARLSVFAEGHREERIVTAVKGDPQLPMSMDEVLAKFVRNSSPSLGESTAARLAEALVTAGEEAPLRDILKPAVRVA